MLFGAPLRAKIVLYFVKAVTDNGPDTRYSYGNNYDQWMLNYVITSVLYKQIYRYIMYMTRLIQPWLYKHINMIQWI